MYRAVVNSLTLLAVGVSPFISAAAHAAPTDPVVLVDLPEEWESEPIEQETPPVRLPDAVVEAIEQEILRLVAELPDSGSGRVGPFNGTEWGAELDARVDFRDPPVLTCDGGDCVSAFFALGGGFDLEAEAVFYVNADARAWVDPPVGRAEGHGDLFAVMQLNVVVPIVRDANGRVVADADMAVATLTQLAGNVVVGGVKDELVLIGSLTSGVIFGDFLFGALIGWAVSDAAADAAEAWIEQQLSRLMNEASAELSVQLRTALSDYEDDLAGILAAQLLTLFPG